MQMRKNGWRQRLALAGRSHERRHRPSWVADEAVWRKAIRAVKFHWRRYEHPYAVVAYVYQRMGGTVAPNAALHGRSADDVLAYRIAYLRQQGEDKRNTAAWRDAMHERAELTASRFMRGERPSTLRRTKTLGDPTLPHGGLDLDTERVELDELGYDARGTYYGVGGQPLWRVHNANLEDEPQIDTVVRAPTARAAKQRVLEQHRH